MTDIVVFGEDFGGLPSSTQHIVQRLATNHRILWVNSIGLRQPKPTSKDIQRLVSKISRVIGNTGSDKPTMHCDAVDNIFTVNLLTIPAPHSAFLRKVAAKMMQHQLEKHLKALNFDNPLFWTSLPTAADVCNAMNKRGLIYYCGDNFGALAGVDHQTVMEHERTLVDNADCILAASDKLAARFPDNKTTTLPHGVDFSLFSTPAEKASDLPNNGRKILGFYGSLSDWLNYRLIDQVAQHAPDWDLVFIGPNEFAHNPLPQRDNVHYLGPRAHHLLPSYSQHWDASWLPFVDNAQIKACNPLKLLEYLATGTPVISTPFPALMPYKHMLHIVADVEDVCASLSHLLPPPNGSTSYVQQQSWEARADQVEKLVRAL
ncbi:glycosyl transferase [Vibrio parahaemolyticus]|uniref:glycosyltransferase n=1 Tax=Vibrio parahaemolyticus TaxID=670 RepID=UPI0004D823A0|nr:glycosyltransferase [Vibrio parahaemolyticus]AVW95106.1 glycosyltransferase family 1 protein [Vibrio parahaemolyticus]EGQ8737331.1 glycosyltransferase [Vibrio parahaemolyticus]EGQ8906820.1 glycosyltransferase [Vibrio parahaemolyticus]EGR3099737.1 glycosyltransferase family 1 protein [Vibrio parahaemolyticus]EIO5871355.1 glycosyltransferase [Vibrio parahaemolyticus]